MDNQREEDRVLMNISNTSGAVMSATLFSARMTFKLVTFLYRLAKKGMVALGAADKFKEFSNATGGRYTAYNIPLSDKHAKTMQELNKLELQLQGTKNPFAKVGLRRQIEKMKKSISELEQLDKLGIKYCMLPKLNGSEQTMQIVVAKDDDQLFKNWFGNHLTAEMSAGGEKNLESIRVFTEGNYTILNMPFEKTEELAEMMSDFNTMKVNYAVLPDLLVGDGYTQVAVPNADRSQVEQWFNMWKDRAISNGEMPKEMFAMDAGSYMNTAAMSADEYIQNADAEYKEVQEEFEKESKQVPVEAGPGKENSEEFMRYAQDDRYQKISINEETLVLDQKADRFAYQKEGLFASRVPGTYGKNEKTLLIPIEQLFVADAGKTYVAFLEKGGSSAVIDRSIGKTVSIPNEKLYSENYANVSRGFNGVEDMKQPKVSKVDISPSKSSAPKPKIDFNL